MDLGVAMTTSCRVGHG